MLSNGADQVLNDGFQGRIHPHTGFDLLAGMHNGSVVPSSELQSYFRSGVLGDFPSNVHGYLSGKGNGFGTLFSIQIRVG